MFELMILSPIIAPIIFIGGWELLMSAVDWADDHPIRRKGHK